MSIPARRIVEPLFGHPSLFAMNNGEAAWVKGQISPLDQKSPTGWLVRLYGGVQTGDDFARVNIPVFELPVTAFNSAQWSYYMTNTETMGVNIVVWVHDPNDFDKRAEITQLGGHSGLEKAAGWNAHELDTSVTQFFFYGEGTTGTGLTAGTQYTWAQFQADGLFKTWTIYRITIEYGWEASGTFEDAFVADVKLNGYPVFLRPSNGDNIGSETKTYTKVTATNSSTKVTLLTPTTGRRIRVLAVMVTSSSTTGATFEVYFATGANIDAAAAKAIFASYLDADLNTGCDNISFPVGAGPLGIVNEVVSMRTSADVSAAGRFTIVYREEV